MLVAEKDKVSIRVFEETDIERKVGWINDPKIHRFLHYDIPLNYERTLAWFKNKDNTKRLDCIIEFDGTPVGLIGLLNIDKMHNKAEIYISMGESAFMRRGIASCAMKMMVEYAFSNYAVHKVYLNTDGENVAAHRLFEKVGFTREGYFVDDMIHNGRYIDRVRYAIICEEY